MMIIKSGPGCAIIVVVSLSLFGGVFHLALNPQNLFLPQDDQNNYSKIVVDKTSTALSPVSAKTLFNFTQAYEQSGGFFDDIPDSQWVMMQQRQAKQFPNHMKDMFRIIPKQASNNWYQNNFEPDFTCAQERRLGAIQGLGDGGKWICDPHRIKKQETCLVYSIGSFGDPTFEQAVKSEISQDCEIHTFDINNSSNAGGIYKDYSKIVSPYASFHHWGIGTKEEAAKFPKKYKSLEETVSLLGHKGRTVDIFKIDCEQCEWMVYKEWFSSGITMKQIQIELHYAPQPMARDFFYNLHNQGYVIFHKEANIINANSGMLVEYAFLKLEKAFFLNKTFSEDSFNSLEIHST